MNHNGINDEGLDAMEAYDLSRPASSESEPAAPDLTPELGTPSFQGNFLDAREPGRIPPKLTLSATLRQRNNRRVSEEISEQIAIERSEAAFQEFYEIVAPKMYAFLFRMLGSEDDALDIMQETFIQLWNKAPMLYSKHANLGSWSHLLAHNLAIEEIRSSRYQHMSTAQSFEPESMEGLLREERTPEGALAAAEAGLEVRKALKQLTPEEQKGIDLVFFRGYTRKQAAEQLGFSEHKFNATVRNALAELEYKLLPLLRSGDRPQRPMPTSVLERLKQKRKKEEAQRIERDIARERAAALQKFLGS